MDVTVWLRAQWDRVAAVVATAGGGLAILVGWIGVSGEILPAAQLPYILSGGIGGLFLLGIGATLWLSADLRDEWRELDALRRELRQGSMERDDEAAVVAPKTNGAHQRTVALQASDRPRR